MAITKTNKLNMTSGAVPLVIHLSQYDADFTLVFDLYNTDGTFTIESGTTVAIRGTKKDGNGYSVDATLDITNKRVTVTGDQQMTAVAGRNIFELTLTKNNKELNTANFILEVERAALDRDTIKSDSIIRELYEVIDQADDIIAAASQVKRALQGITVTDDGNGNLTFIKSEVGPEPTVINLDVSKLERKGLMNTSPYNAASRTTRITYTPFDLYVEPGTYKVTWESSISLQMSGGFYSVNAEAAISNSQDITNYESDLPSYISSGDTIVIPSTVKGSAFWRFRPTWKKPDDSDISSASVITKVTLTKED